MSKPKTSEEFNAEMRKYKEIHWIRPDEILEWGKDNEDIVIQTEDGPILFYGDFKNLYKHFLIWSMEDDLKENLLDDIEVPPAGIAGKPEGSDHYLRWMLRNNCKTGICRRELIPDDQNTFEVGEDKTTFRLLLGSQELKSVEFTMAELDEIWGKVQRDEWRR